MGHARTARRILGRSGRVHARRCDRRRIGTGERSALPVTLLDDRPATYRTLAREPMPRSSLSPWRFAARLAQREVRRRPGRTVLVALLGALPVGAMTVGSVLYRTTTDDWESTFERQ